jgi:hypothetical protein
MKEQKSMEEEGIEPHMHAAVWKEYALGHQKCKNFSKYLCLM